MSELHNHLLWLAILWPLLLAFPRVSIVVPRPAPMAIAPALALVLLPGEAAMTLPRYFVSMGLELDNSSRWILAMVILVWLGAALPGRYARLQGQHTGTPLLMMTLAGASGLVLATDMTGFYSFSALMGYSFYGLLVRGAHEPGQGAGRLYILALLIADVALLEAMLKAGLQSHDLRFATVQRAMGESASPLYVVMVFMAFALKAGVWPVHWWLRAGYQVATLPTMMLLAGVPVAMGLFGMATWLPLGEAAFPKTGRLVQGLGGAAVLYAGFRLLTRAPAVLREIPAWSVTLLSGLFLILTGTGLAHPAFWQNYGFLMPPLIVVTGVTGALLSFFPARREPVVSPEIPEAQRVEGVRQWIQRGADLLTQKKRLLEHRLFELRKAARTVWLGHSDKSSVWQILSTFSTFSNHGNRWSLKVMLFVMLGLVLGLMVTLEAQGAFS